MTSLYLEGLKIGPRQRIALRPPVAVRCGKAVYALHLRKDDDPPDNAVDGGKVTETGSNVMEYIQLATDGHPGMIGLIFCIL